MVIANEGVQRPMKMKASGMNCAQGTLGLKCLVDGDKEAIS